MAYVSSTKPLIKAIQERYPDVIRIISTLSGQHAHITFLTCEHNDHRQGMYVLLNFGQTKFVYKETELSQVPTPLSRSDRELMWWPEASDMNLLNVYVNANPHMSYDWRTKQITG